jgi:predicted TIM-barrel fold metal-dependent hydrolase
MPTRRGFVSQAAGFAALGAAGPIGWADDRTPGAASGFVDGHCHVWTPDTGRYPLADGFATADMRPPSFTAEELLALCRPLGVSRVVLIQMSFYRFDNAYMLDCIAASPGVFSGVAVVDPDAADLPQRVQRLARAGVRGFRLRADRAGAERWAESEGIRELWRLCADAGLAICALADPEAIRPIRRMGEAFPRTTVVIDHFARIGMQGRVEPSDVDELARLAELPRVHVKTSAFYALGAKRPPYDDLAGLVRKLRDAFGAERLLWGTDCPYQAAPGQGYEASLAFVRDRLDFLSDGERRAILRDTATRLFFPDA